MKEVMRSLLIAPLMKEVDPVTSPVSPSFSSFRDFSKRPLIFNFPFLNMKYNEQRTRNPKYNLHNH